MILHLKCFPSYKKGEKNKDFRKVQGFCHRPCIVCELIINNLFTCAKCKGYSFFSFSRLIER